MRKNSDRFELLVADECQQQIIRTSFDELAALHERAAALRTALVAHGYLPVGYTPPPAVRMGASSEPRTAFCGLIECAELLALQKRDVGSALRHAATIGLVAVGLQDLEMMKDAVTQSRQTLERSGGRRAGDDAFLKSCEALLERVEASFQPPASTH